MMAQPEVVSALDKFEESVKQFSQKFPPNRPERPTLPPGGEKADVRRILVDELDALLRENDQFEFNDLANEMHGILFTLRQFGHLPQSVADELRHMLDEAAGLFFNDKREEARAVLDGFRQRVEELTQ
jgi:hypothetical protein